MIPNDVRDGVSVFTIQNATWREVDNEYNVVAVFVLSQERKKTKNKNCTSGPLLSRHH